MHMWQNPFCTKNICLQTLLILFNLIIFFVFYNLNIVFVSPLFLKAIKNYSFLNRLILLLWFDYFGLNIFSVTWLYHFYKRFSYFWLKLVVFQISFSKHSQCQDHRTFLIFLKPKLWLRLTKLFAKQWESAWKTTNLSTPKSFLFGNLWKGLITLTTTWLVKNVKPSAPPASRKKKKPNEKTSTICFVSKTTLFLILFYYCNLNIQTKIKM